MSEEGSEKKHYSLGVSQSGPPLTFQTLWYTALLTLRVRKGRCVCMGMGGQRLGTSICVCPGGVGWQRDHPRMDSNCPKTTHMVRSRFRSNKGWQLQLF